VVLTVYPRIVARQRLGKHVPAAMKNCWRRRFLCNPYRMKGKRAINSSQNYFRFLEFKETVYLKILIWGNC
jgi:hypothetical protein